MKILSFRLNLRRNSAFLLCAIFFLSAIAQAQLPTEEELKNGKYKNFLSCTVRMSNQGRRLTSSLRLKNEIAAVQRSQQEKLPISGVSTQGPVEEILNQFPLASDGTFRDEDQVQLWLAKLAVRLRHQNELLNGSLNTTNGPEYMTPITHWDMMAALILTDPQIWAEWPLYRSKIHISQRDLRLTSRVVPYSDTPYAEQSGYFGFGGKRAVVRMPKLNQFALSTKDPFTKLLIDEGYIDGSRISEGEALRILVSLRVALVRAIQIEDSNPASFLFTEGLKNYFGPALAAKFSILRAFEWARYTLGMGKIPDTNFWRMFRVHLLGRDPNFIATWTRIEDLYRTSQLTTNPRGVIEAYEALSPAERNLLANEGIDALFEYLVTRRGWQIPASTLIPRIMLWAIVTAIEQKFAGVLFHESMGPFSSKAANDDPSCSPDATLNAYVASSPDFDPFKNVFIEKRQDGRPGYNFPCDSSDRNGTVKNTVLEILSKFPENRTDSAEKLNTWKHNNQPQVESLKNIIRSKYFDPESGCADYLAWWRCHRGSPGSPL